MDAFLIFLVKDQEETFYSDEKTSVIAIEVSYTFLLISNKLHTLYTTLLGAVKKEKIY